LLPAFSAGDAWALYPDRIVKIVVPFAPGGGTDVIARTLAQEMAKDLGATVIIENKPGRAPSSAPRPSPPASRMAIRC
jgi:tripartite-type tricarboxylate transporter receptor subunit TctC